MPTATRRYFSNVAALSALAADCTATDTLLTLTTLAGQPSSFPYTLTIARNDLAKIEVVEVTAKNIGTNQVTVTRGVDGTTGVAHLTGIPVEHTATARDFDQANQHASTASVSTAHGAVGQGDVTNGYVDLSSAQTIAGVKTFSASPVVPDGSFTIAKTTSLQSTLDAKYSAANAPPYPVTSVAGRGGAVSLTAADVGAGTFPGNVVFGAGAEWPQFQWARFDMASGAPGYVAGNGTQLFLRGGSTGVAVRNNADTANTATLDNVGNFAAVGNVNDSSGRVYSPGNAPPYPVTTVAGRAGAVALTAADIGAGTFSGSFVMTGTLTLSGVTQGIEHGAFGTANTPFMDWHSGATGVDYDVRMQASGGTGTSGQGTFDIYAQAVTLHQSSPGVTGSVLSLGSDSSVGGRGPELALLDTKAGQATPNKFIRSNSGHFQVINNAYSAAILDIDDSGNAVFVGALSGYGVNRQNYGLRAGMLVSGGGTVSFDPVGSFGWSDRFIVIAAGHDAAASTAGYFDIIQPTSGAVAVAGGAGARNWTTAGIVLGAWEALWYQLPIGSSNTSIAGNFLVAAYSGAWVPPGSDWICLAVCNGDPPSATLKTCVGDTMKNGQSRMPGGVAHAALSLAGWATIPTETRYGHRFLLGGM